MPDLDLTRAYNRSLLGIERQILPKLMSDYRDFRKELLDALERFGLSSLFRAAAQSAGAQLQSSARDLAREQQAAISEVAQRYADRQLQVLRKKGLAPEVTPRVIAPISFSDSVAASVEMVEAQLLNSAAQLSLKEEADVIGQLLSVKIVDGRASAWRLGRNRLMSDTILAVWAAANGVTGRIYDQASAQSGETYQRQAIAAIDERTTDCCLKVHGQVVGQNEKFHLTGTPRFADYVFAPPFHWNCRTAVALYHPLMEDLGLTSAEMREAARDEDQARQRTGMRVEIHPAHATSRRN